MSTHLHFFPLRYSPDSYVFEEGGDDPAPLGQVSQASQSGYGELLLPRPGIFR